MAPAFCRAFFQRAGESQPGLHRWIESSPHRQVFHDLVYGLVFGGDPDVTQAVFFCHARDDEGTGFVAHPHQKTARWGPFEREGNLFFRYGTVEPSLFHQDPYLLHDEHLVVSMKWC